MIRAFLVLTLLLAGCGNRYSADEYATRAVQQANRTEQGVVAGFRRIQIAADGTTGAAAGAAAGGVLGSATPGNRVAEALGAVGGALMGGLIGSAAERAANSGDGVEYVVRKRNGDLVSVVQRDLVPLEVGARVLVIEGAQARIVPDYTVPAPGPGPVPAPAPAPSTMPQQPDQAPDLGIAPAQLLRELPGWMGDGPALQTLPSPVPARERSI
jgi:outer membrane lipoprotein SlyB